jgi:hypothetical protein
MARRPDKREAEMLSEENLAELRHNLDHLSLPAVRDRYEQAHRDCRLISDRLPSPRQMQTLVQVWKLLWKWRYEVIGLCFLAGIVPQSWERHQPLRTLVGSTST